jgi:two-component system, chemotaxis family, chemotaxis protein CheY
MIVDDSILTRRLLGKLLADGGHEVVYEAADGATAVSNYQACRPDITTMDIQMPVMDGLMAAAKILNEHPSAKVLFLTSTGNTEMVMKALGMGVSGYLLKPLDKSKVLTAIEGALKA